VVARVGPLLRSKSKTSPPPISYFPIQKNMHNGLTFVPDKVKQTKWNKILKTRFL